MSDLDLDYAPASEWPEQYRPSREVSDLAAGLEPARARLPRTDVELVCALDPELWFSDDARDQSRAKGFCRTCPVREACLRVAIENGDEYGIFGGLTPMERRAAAGDFSPVAVAVRTAYLQDKGRSVASLANEYGVSRQQANGWLSDLRQEAVTARRARTLQAEEAWLADRTLTARQLKERFDIGETTAYNVINRNKKGVA